MNIFFDTEFTGLHRNTTLISIGLITETGEGFYAEFNDYDKHQINGWLQDNVIDNLILKDDMLTTNDNQTIYVKGDTNFIKNHLEKWLSKFDNIEMWGDVISYDWILFTNLFDNSILPNNIYYIPFDLSTLLKVKGVDPDISREEFVSLSGDKHNSLWDAIIIKKCYDKLNNP
jgi:hypothetical protein